MRLGAVGVWWSRSWDVEGQPGLKVGAELEALGYGAVWSSGGFGSGLSAQFGRLLADTTNLVVASGIVNIWTAAPQAVAEAVYDLEHSSGGRFLLGLGASHDALVEGYERPYAHMVSYLDALDDAEPAVPRDQRALAALGPRMLALSAERAGGAHPYFVPVEHTAFARRILGDGPLLAPEQTVVLEREPSRAREVARSFTTGYLGLPNYANNLRRLGFSDDDVAGGGSDRLVDAVVAWGDASTIAARVREHHQAGADHVCLQVVAELEGFPLAAYRELAEALF